MSIKGDGIAYDLPQEIDILSQTENFTKCVVYVRPARNWGNDEAGHNFGFDWMRIEDSRIRGDVNYATNMGRLWVGRNLQPNSNSIEGRFRVSPNLYRGLLSRHFRERYTITWKWENSRNKRRGVKEEPDSSIPEDTPENRRERRRIESESEYKYYVPALNLMNGDSANLQLIVDTAPGIDLPERIEWRIQNESLLSVEASLRPESGRYECVVTCNGVIKETQIITFVAIYRSQLDDKEKEEPCGFLKVLPNSDVKELKVLLVDCVFSIGEDDFRGIINDDEIRYAKKILGQGLVELDYAQETYIVPAGSLTERTLVAASARGHFRSASAIIGNLLYNQGSGVYEYLRSRGLLDKYRDHILVIALGRECRDETESETSRTTRSTLGVMRPVNATFTFSNATSPISFTPSESIILLFEGRNHETLVHEILHATGLLHSFSSESTFGYRPQRTDNIMDSRPQHNAIPRIATWQWQWEEVRKHIDRQSGRVARRAVTETAVARAIEEVKQSMRQEE